jgi:peptidoglycan/LPS O-acetylase OafA/YrhL
MSSLSALQITFLVILVLWEFIWKGIALWRAAKRNERNWFIALLIISSAGFLPIVYLLSTSMKIEDADSTYINNPLAQ